MKKLISIDDFLDIEKDGVFYTGHASIIARINRKNFLFDFVKDNMPYGDRWRFFPSMTESVPMEKIDGVFVSHMHQDHFDPLFLKSHEIRCPIYVIEGRSSFKDALNRYNIDHVNIPAGKKTEISPGVYVYGLHHQSNGIDASCCIGNRNFSVYHGNDNYLDNEILNSIDSEFSNIDVACIPYAYINWYPQLLDNLTDEEKERESERLCDLYFEYAIAQANKLNATQVVPFGANLVYKDSARSPLNLECKTPLEFEEYVRKNRGNKEGLRFKAIFSGDSIIKHQEELSINSADIYDPKTYRDKMQEFLAEISKNDLLIKNNPLKSTSLPLVKIETPTSYVHFVCVRLDESEDGVMINTKTSEVEKLNLQFLNSNNFDYHLFNIKTPDIYWGWINGNLKIEEIIGSREFSVTRQPNIYNKEVFYIANTQL
jgi:L-ascorbate metabolism protein UlaG (beta-lactamase superfamily)